ncbi:MAG: glycosyl hydrolase 53 family protein [Anaerolineales bacterium]|nr:glycosyl hydrolase 53 family protein [Anaerolineales bacterium]
MNVLTQINLVFVKFVRRRRFQSRPPLQNLPSQVEKKVGVGRLRKGSVQFQLPIKKFLPGMILFVSIFFLSACTPQESTSLPAEPTPLPAATATVPQPLDTPTMNPSPTNSPEPTQPPTDSPPTPTPAPVTLTNPSFEDGDLTGWETDNPGANLLEDSGYESAFRLTHQGTEPYRVETLQNVTNLVNGWYTLRAWVRSSGGQNETYLALQCGENERRVHVPSTQPGYRWLNVVVSNEVTDGRCTIRLFSDANAGNWVSFDDLTLLPGQTALTILGADISSLKKSEDFGGVYRETDGTPGDPLDILKNHGLNYVRLRVWVDPADGYHNKDKLLEMALRFKEKGIKLLVDFHYSDNWADPGKQFKPAAWETLDFEALKQAMYDHTFDVCSALVAQGTPPDMVQVGNEINSGMLWPDGHTWDPPQWDNLAQLLTAGYDAVKACSPDTRVMLHIAEGGDNELAKWWFGNITTRDVPFDVIGISYYPFWHGKLAELQFNLNDISARYDKDVVVVETAYAFTTQNDDFLSNIFGPEMETPGYPLTPEGQGAMLRDVMAVVRAVPNGRGLGVFYWDATWTAVEGNGWDNTDPASGNAWENQALFDFEGIVLPALDEYLSP